jgi:hypothetical protein
MFLEPLVCDMARFRYRVTCRECGEIEDDVDVLALRREDITKEDLEI